MLELVFTNAAGGTLSFWCNPANTTGTKDMWSAHNGAWTGNYGWIIRTDGNLIWALMYNSGETNCLNIYEVLLLQCQLGFLESHCYEYKWQYNRILQKCI